MNQRDSTPDVCDLPPVLRESLERCFAAGRRFYVAWHPDYPTAVLRHKDAAGLAEWESRSWQMFNGDKPLIVDVTAAIPGLWRDVLSKQGAHPREWIKDVCFTPPDSLVLARVSVPMPANELFGIPMGATNAMWLQMTGHENGRMLTAQHSARIDADTRQFPPLAPRTGRTGSAATPLAPTLTQPGSTQ